MSTRAIYTFIEDNDDTSYHVYKHHDGYPSGAAEFIANALTAAWKLPRFEADEFACAFIAANKASEGGFRALRSGNWRDVSPLDIEYRYEISRGDGGRDLFVTAYTVGVDDYLAPKPVRNEHRIFQGTLTEFVAKANQL